MHPEGVEIRLRPAQPSDAEFMFVLARAALGPYVEEIWGWRDDEQRSRQEDWFARTPAQVIEADAEAVGCLSVVEHDDSIVIDRIALLPPWQGRGIGTRLMRQVMEDAERRDLPVRLSVLDNNPARRLYERLGFQVTSVAPPRITMEWRARARR